MGTLFVVATPIGNLEDVSARALRTLREVSLIAAEDTRHSRRLLSRHAIATPLLSYHAHNQRARRDHLLDALAEGDVALISDAGTPAISDPGADLVAAALDAGYPVSPIPGPSALTAAVCASGIVDGPFVTLGFLPRERAKRAWTIAKAAASGFPLVVFAAPHRLLETLEALLAALGDRKAVLARELTKIHEEIRAGSLATLRDWVAANPPRGEIVLVIEGGAEEAASASEASDVVSALRRSGLSASQAAREAAAITGLPRGELYRLASEVTPGGSIGLEGQLSLADEHTLQESLGDKKGPEG